MAGERFKEWEFPKTDIGVFTCINAKNGIVLENHVQVGSHYSIYSVPTFDNKEGKVTLKKNNRVGSHSIIMPGVTMLDGGK